MSIKQINDRLKELNGWELNGFSSISKTFEFSGPAQVSDFANKIQEEADRADHHPDLSILKNKVIVSLTTHEKNALTDKDFRLAKVIEQLF